MAQFIAWGSWTTTSISGSTIANGSSETTAAAIPMNNKSDAQIGIALTYGATKTESARIYIKENAFGNPETRENAFPVTVEGSASETHHKVISLSSHDYVEPVIEIVNDSGSTITAVSVQYRNAEVGSA